MNYWAQVDTFEDGNSVNADTLNKPISQLASRTDYLKRQLGTILDSGVQSSLVLPNVTLSNDQAFKPEIGNVVYCSSTHKEFRKAQATMSLCDDFTAADSAFSVGILISKTTENVGNVLIYGQFNLGDPGISKENMFEEGESFRSGRYYVSAIEPGKLTANPSGPLILIGAFYSNGNDSGEFNAASVAYINPQYMDIGTSHVHRAYPLVARPAGSLDGLSVIGHLPIGASINSLSAAPMGSSSETEEQLISSLSQRKSPSLIFGGTWTSESDISYRFALSDSGKWGEVELYWYKNGDKSRRGTVSIPAPGVFVDIDNGLKVKVLFPEATSEYAYNDLPSEMREWAPMTMPGAGKGWVDHSVDAIASSTADPECKVRALLSGTWPDHDNRVTVILPKYASSLRYDSVDDYTNPDEHEYPAPTAEIGGTVYMFATDGKTDVAEVVPVARAATVNESLLNLAEKVNSSRETPCAFVDDDTLVVCDEELSTQGAIFIDGIPEDGVELIGGNIPISVVYSFDYSIIGHVLTDIPTYVPASLGRLNLTIFATDTKESDNYVCYGGTTLKAEAYDHVPEAVYEYVMGLHQEVDYYYPPVPAQAAGLFVNGVEVESATLFPSNPTYAIGRKTLYWMESERGKLPWPDGIISAGDYVEPYNDKTMAFYFIVGFQCASGPVTSIIPAPDSGIKLYTYGTNDNAYTGDLMIDVALDMKVVDGGVSGYKVAKKGQGGKLLAGAVVERIKAGNGISITQPEGCPPGQGTVTIGLDDGSTSNHFTEIALENAKQEKIGLFPYISLLGWGSTDNIPSAFTAMMRVPQNLEDKNYKLQVKAVLFGVSSYEGSNKPKAAGIQLEYNILPDFTDSRHLSIKTGLIKPTTPRTVAVPFGHKDTYGTWTYTAYDPFVVTTDTSVAKKEDVIVPAFGGAIPSAYEFTSDIPKLKPGYLVAVRLSRTDAPISSVYEPYSGAIGFLSFEWELQEA